MAIGATTPDAADVNLHLCLQLPEFAGAELLNDSGSMVPIQWVSVIEWPVEDFVSPSDLVLTTGLGCDTDRLCQMVVEIAHAGAAAACIAVGSAGLHGAVPDAVTRAAEQAGLSLVALPWRVRFSDIARSVILMLRGEGARPSSQSGDLPATFAQALLKSNGVVGVSTALESIIDAPVIVFDGGLSVLGSGSQGAQWMKDPANAQLILTAMPDSMKPELGNGNRTFVLSPRSDPTQNLVVAPASVSNGVVAWVVAIGPSDRTSDPIERGVLHAAMAVAIDVARDRQANEAELRARSDFIWTLTRGAPPPERELAARLALLGLPLNARYGIAVGLVEPPPGKDRLRVGTAQLASWMCRRLPPSSILAFAEHELLIGIRSSETAARNVLEHSSGDLDTVLVTWGLAAGDCPLADIAPAYEQARTTAVVTRSLHGAGHTAEAAELGPYLLLYPASADPLVRRSIGEVLRPLKQADRLTEAELVRTLQVYLEENGNISSSARKLHLNRHSLMYRLRRIEHLTGLDLNSNDDRLTLEVSLRVDALARDG